MIAAVTAIVVGMSMISGAVSDRAEAVVGSDFDPGNIISDATFYDSGSMSIQQIQDFLNARRPTCRAGNICLKDYSDSFATREANARCGYLQGQRMSAAAVIYWVGRACGINPKSLIVLLEKEQGLVTSDAPSAARYRIAMGFGCPDTAPCDSLYYGFFNQVYNAARQFKVYRDSPGSFRYQAGRVNTVQWHPNAACGSSSFFIDNQATAGLYNYTPYRPNGAALANLYGSGDGCSSYGNRNFWRLFSDWFGRTNQDADFVRTSSDPTVWLVSGSRKHLVPSFAVLTALAPLGGYRIVSADFIASLPTGDPMNETIRDSQSGAISLVQDGAAHSFASCELMTLYGYDCADAVDLVPSQLAKFARGGAVSEYFRIDGGADVFRIVDGRRVRFSNMDALDAHAGGRPSYIASMRPEVGAARSALSRTLMAPLSLVRSTSSPSVFLVDGWDRKIPVSSLDIGGEYSSRQYRIEDASVLASYPTVSTVLTIAASCGGSPMIAGSRTLTPVTPSDLGTVLPTALSADSCARLTINPAGRGNFVKTPSSPVVSMLRSGRLYTVADFGTLVGLNGGTVPAVSTMSNGSAASFGAPIVSAAPASLAYSPDSVQVFLIDGFDRKIPVTSFNVPAEFGVSSLAQIPATTLNRYAVSDAALGMVWECGGVSSFGAGGQRYALAGGADTGLPRTTLSDSSCALLTRAVTPALTRLFIRSAGSPTVYLVEGGKRRAITSWTTLLSSNGGAAPTIPIVSVSTIRSIPEGDPVR